MSSRRPLDNGALLAIGGVGTFALAGMAIRRGSMNPSMQTVAEVRALNRSRGGSFFDKSIMDRFKTRIETPKLMSGGYFVTSEKFAPVGGGSYPRRFTLRKAMKDGAVQTVGRYMEFASKQQAVQAAQGLA